MSSEMACKAVVMEIPPSVIVFNCQHSAANSPDLMRFRRPFCCLCLVFLALPSVMEIGMNPFSRSQFTTSLGDGACRCPSFRCPDESRATYLKLFIFSRISYKLLLLWYRFYPVRLNLFRLYRTFKIALSVWCMSSSICWFVSTIGILTS